MTLAGTYNYEEEWLLESPQLTEFIDAVNQIRTTVASPQEAVDQIRPYFDTSVTAKGTYKKI